MTDRDACLMIMNGLLIKYRKRLEKYGETEIGRRILLKITEVYRDYEKGNADIEMKTCINEAAGMLEEMQYITVERLPFSDDIKKIYLAQDRVDEIEGFLEERFGEVARNRMRETLESLIYEYTGLGKLTDYYCSSLRERLKGYSFETTLDREKDILEALLFIQGNETDLYIREMSILVYGDSKLLEKQYLNVLCNIIRAAEEKPCAENEQNDSILQQFHIWGMEQEICIKGDWLIQIAGQTIETKYLKGGLSLSSKDLHQIEKITLQTNNLMTIENKTSYYRLVKEDFSMMYLGGYASRYQTAFLKKIYVDNTSCHYWHFGDIDVGGLLIHQYLCAATGIPFEMFHMGKEELNDIRYKKALRSLTEQDIIRAEGISRHPLYREVIEEMLRKGVKLEQEIISYYITEGET